MTSTNSRKKYCVFAADAGARAGTGAAGGRRNRPAGAGAGPDARADRATLPRGDATRRRLGRARRGDVRRQFDASAARSTQARRGVCDCDARPPLRSRDQAQLFAGAVRILRVGRG